MSERFDKVRQYVLELGLRLDQEIPAEEMLIVSDPERGIHHLIIDAEEELLVLEQLILKLDPQVPDRVYRRILQMNRGLVCGAFVLDEQGEILLFRDTLALANLDLNELEGSINALSLGLAEYGQELLGFARK